MNALSEKAEEFLKKNGIDNLDISSIDPVSNRRYLVVIFGETPSVFVLNKKDIAAIDPGEVWPIAVFDLFQNRERKPVLTLE